MGIYRIILDAAEAVEDLSSILNCHDNTGDVNPDDIIKECAIAAALAFNNAKVEDTDRGDYKPEDFQAQLTRITDILKDFYKEDSYSIVSTAVNLFISDLATDLISAIEDQTHTPIYDKLNEGLSIVFKVMDGKNETKDINGVSAP